MLRFVLLFILFVFVPSLQAQHEMECDAPPADVFDAWFTAAYADVLASHDKILVNDPIWTDLYDDFAAFVLEYVNECGDEATDLSYEGTFESGDDLLFGYAVMPSVSPIDINLDGIDDWQVRLQTGSPRYGRVVTLVNVLYREEDSAAWAMIPIWPLDIVGNVRVAAQSIYVHDEADVSGRTYMGIPFYPGLGPEPYVGGLVVLRWDGWEPEIVLFVEQQCVFSNWQTGRDGGLYIPVSGTVPWQGCLPPGDISEHSLQIPDAVMSLHNDTD